MLRKNTLILFALITIALMACAAPAASTPAAPPASTEAVTAAATEPATEAATEAAFSVSVTDSAGNTLNLTAKPQRIVSLTLGTDEILLDMVGPERLLAMTKLAADATTSNIADRLELAQIPNAVEADPEQIIGLEPDLVFVGSFTDAAVIEQLQKAGVPVFVVGNFTSVDAMMENITTLGTLVGEEDKATAMIIQMQDALETVNDIIGSPAKKPTVLYLASDGWVAGAKTTVDSIIAYAGGVNAAAALNDWNQVNQEAIIQMNPDVVILSPYVTDAEFLTNPAYASMAAVKNKRVASITDAHMSATSQYITSAVEDVAKLLYPELFQ
jgi:iron complex transport system substrate-binding protein